MAKKKKIQETTIENYYDLKIDKVDELVAALKDDGAVNEDISFDIYECTGVHFVRGIRLFLYLVYVKRRYLIYVIV